MPPLSENYWRGLEELAADPSAFAEVAARLPGLAAADALRMDRRRLLQLMGASLALAGLGGCDVRQPDERIYPYVRMPEDVIPGRPQHYASVLTLGGYGRGVLVESHSGRPTKIDGNPRHPASLGATDPFMQAEVLGLYDPERSRAPQHQGRIATWDGFLGELAGQRRRLAATGGAGCAVLTPTITSPSLAGAIESLQARYPRLAWYSHEPVHRDAVHRASLLAFDEVLEPVYQPQRARVVLSLGADFIAPPTPGALAYARELARARRAHHPDASMARVYALESTPGLTGGVADHRLALAPDELEFAARALARRLGIAAPGPEPAAHGAWLDGAAADLRAAAEAALVVAGEQQPPAVQALAHALNARLGALGQTVRMVGPVAFGDALQGQSLEQLRQRLEADEIDSLLVLGGNPVYEVPEFAAAYERARWRVHLGPYADETAARSHWHLPEHHALESWGDARAHEGTAALRQPLVRPLHNSRSAAQVLAALGGDFASSDLELTQAYWRRAWGNDFAERWPLALHAGVVEGSAAPARSIQPHAELIERLPEPPRPTAGLMLELLPDPATFDGRFANNGWLQELPRPLTRLVWGNAALVSPRLAADLGLANGARVELELDGRRLSAPIWINPGQAERCIGLNIGYGRRHAGRVGNGVGVYAYGLRPAPERWQAGGLRLSPLGGAQALVSTQHEGRMHGRDLVREATLARYRREPDFASDGKPGHLPSLYPEPPQQGAGAPAEVQWGMSIDLSACIGCQACVIACQAENNTPVVGAQEVARGHGMHWLRVDRYYQGPPAAPRVAFQPVPCMHCEQAPCEYVCPVGATTHSADGLNEMTYNRCIGTRDCSQNCPYKVRRFNWFDYSQSTPAAQHNPNVTVRTRGVMEKCTYCVQRIRTADIRARIEDRPIGTDEVVTACQAACPTEAISFGDIRNPDSEVHRRKRLPLDYGLLAELGTRPRTTYLARVRHPNPKLEDG